MKEEAKKEEKEAKKEEEVTVEEYATKIADANDAKMAKRLEDFKSEFVTMSELQAALKDIGKMDINDVAKKNQNEVKFWQDLITGKTAGDIIDTVDAATLVPTAIADKIRDQIQKVSYVRNLCTVYPDDKGSLFVKSGGATAYRTAENVAPNSGTPSTLKYNAISYNGYDVAADVIVSNKLIKQSKPKILDFVYAQLGQAFANLEEIEFITGSGTNQFTGLNAATIAAVTAAATHTTLADLTYDDILDLYLSVPQQYRKLASWLLTTDAIKVIKKLKDNNGLPIFNATDEKLFTKPYNENANISTTGTTNPVIYFGFWKDFFIFDKGELGMTATNQGKELVSKRQTYVIAFSNTDGKVIDKTGMRGLKLAAS